MSDRILTPEQVAEMLQLHPFTILNYIKQGKLHAARLGRVYRIRESDVFNLLDSSAVSEPKRDSETEPTPTS